MAEKLVDARGLACPQPVVLTRKAILEAGVTCVRVLLDSKDSAENVQRLAKSQGWELTEDQRGQEIQLTLTRGGAAGAETQAQPQAQASAGQRTLVVFVTSNLFGVGEEKLGQILMKAFIKTLKELQPRPVKVIFANSGVRLTTEGSDLIDELRALEAEGTAVLSCGTCLDYYGLKQALRVGVVSNMYEIATSLAEADRVVHP